MNNRRSDGTELCPATQFPLDTAGHEMTVLHDDAPYRHLIRNPGSSAHWFEIMTWPGSLAVRGDMVGYQFSGNSDMLAFFSSGDNVNPDDWYEKLGAGPATTRIYSEDVARARVDQELRQWLVELGFRTDLEPIDTEEFGPSDHGYNEARAIAIRLVDSVRDKVLPARGDEILLGKALTAFDVEGHYFENVWEWDLHEFTYQYLWTCHAIRWGTAQYSQYRASQTTTTKATAPAHGAERTGS